MDQTIEQSHEQSIRERIDEFAQAIRDKDLSAVLACYSPEIVSFDLVPPLQYKGLDEYRKPWEETFAAYDGPIGYEVRDLTIATDNTLAFSYSYNQMSGVMKDGQKMALWVRWTACWQRINNEWLIVHEQVSVPIDLTKGTAVLTLQP